MNNKNYTQIKDQGYLIVRDFLSKNQVETFRSESDSYLNKYPCFNETEDSKILPGFAGVSPQMKDLNELHYNEKLLKVLEEVFNYEKFIFADHSDLHQNKITGWHRDVHDYMSKDRGNGKEEGLWSSDCFIIKVCFLLQDHMDNDYGLWFKPKTHLSNIDGNKIIANTQSTDMIIFDQRILHAGQTDKPRFHEKFGIDRYLITYAFGLDNIHTQIHSKGATLRQDKQRKMMTSSKFSKFLNRCVDRKNSFFSRFKNKKY